jgi:hypothetical protein
MLKLMRIAIVMLCCGLGACAQSGEPKRGVPVTFDAVCDKSNAGKRVMVVGFVDFPLGFDDKDVSLTMRVRPSLASWENTIGANAKIGTAPNNVERPPQVYKNRDLKLHLADGQVVVYSTKVKVSGIVYYPSSLPRGDLKCALSETLFERAANR